MEATSKHIEKAKTRWSKEAQGRSGEERQGAPDASQKGFGSC